MNARIALFPIVALSVVLRLYPTIISGLPYSTDAWPLIHDAQSVAYYHSIQIVANIDPYNANWPLPILFGAGTSNVIGIPVIELMRYIIPFVASLGIIPFFVMVERAYGTSVAIGSSLIFASTGFYALFTAAATKETFSDLIFIFLLLVVMTRQIGKKENAVITLGFVALVASHDLTSYLLLLILTLLALSEILGRIKYKISFRPNLVYASIISWIIFSLYYGLYGESGISTFGINLTQGIIATLLVVLVFVIFWYFTFVYRRLWQTIGKYSLLVGLTPLLLVLIDQKYHFVSNTPTYGPVPLFYLVCYSVLGAFAVQGFYSACIKNVPDARDALTKNVERRTWTIGLIALTCFMIVITIGSSSLALSLLYRSMSFYFVFISVFGVLGISSFVSNVRIPKLKLLSLFLVLVFFAGVGILMTYSANIMQENGLGYQWFYHQDEFTLGSWVNSTGRTSIITSDEKIGYMYADYFGINFGLNEGFQFLNYGGSLHDHELVTYQAMSMNGYVLGLYGTPLPSDWTTRLGTLDKIGEFGPSAIYLQP